MNLDLMRVKKPKYDGRYGLRPDYYWVDDVLNGTIGTINFPNEIIETFRKYETEKENKMIIENSYVCINGEKYKASDVRVNHYSSPLQDSEVEVRAFLCPNNKIVDNVSKSKAIKAAPVVDIPQIKNVIFNYPATIVFWSDGTKTIVKCMEGEEWDPQDGINAAIAKKIYGNEARKWVKKGQYEKVPTYDVLTVNVAPDAALKDIAEGVKKALKKVRELKNAL